MVKLKFKSTYANEQVHFSNTVSLSIVCGTSYTITLADSGYVNSPQELKHDSESGFILPEYQTSQNQGCPVETVQVSSTNLVLTAPDNLRTEKQENGEWQVKLITPAVGTSKFYAKVTTKGGSTGFFGEY